ncbi:Clavaminate synthase-like protein [Aspergillus taichungensis]|uniref:Clavaminate synthase-like protein n=1 Tax=Aspergillus taichungensis TaxID=482145 RepID=A0A2J5I7N7_9EURO|nr:Clavaminate synthase-like protein [Aspergillus taichungensis]
MESKHDNFNGLPPFPSTVPTAPLLRLSLSKLLTQDETETKRLIEASEEIGFFYLDLQEPSCGNDLLDAADKLFQTGKDLFSLDLEEKQKYDFSGQKSYFGYKSQGAAVVDRQGNLDRNEFYNVSKDDILGIMDTLPAPDVLLQKRRLLELFMRSSHSIVTLILNLLNTNLGLPDSTLANLHRLTAPSGDQIRFVKAPPQPIDDRRTAMGEHTDFGSVTILFNRIGGLQVLPPGEHAEWLYVRPLPGHAIINLGDAMVKFTNGLLRSNIHRVVSPPGDQADSTRYSLVYFSRPEDSVMLRRLEGSIRIPVLQDGDVEEQVNSKDWIIRRALGRRGDAKDIDFEKSAGTEMLSRRIKVFALRTPRSSFSSDPTSPCWSHGSQGLSSFEPRDGSSSPSSTEPRLQCKNDTDTLTFHSDVLDEIEHRQDCFFEQIWRIVQPLLGQKGLDNMEGIVRSGSPVYERLDSQPEGLRGQLKPYQLDGLSFLLYLRENGIGGILGDEMGLGKTIQTLALFQHIKENGDFTPIQNDLKELWSIFHWLYPGVFFPETARLFEDSFILNEGQIDTDFLDHVKKFLKLVMIRRLKDSREVGLDIPPMRETILSVPLSRMQYSWYMGILTGVDQPVNEDGVSTPSGDYSTVSNWQETLWNNDDTLSQSTIRILPVKEKKKYKIQANTLMELRKCSIHPYMLRAAIPEEDPSGRNLVAVSGKFVVLEKLVRNYLSEGRKMIIFSNFDQALNLCEDMLQVLRSQTSFEYARLDGSTSSVKRRLSVHLLNNDIRYMVFLLAIRAGGEGLNLVGSSVVVFLDEDWNPQIMRQAEARVHRIGQTRAVDIFRLHAKGTVEEQMSRRLLKKAYLADRVVEDRALGVPLSPTESSVPLGHDSPGRPTSSVEEKEWLKRAEGVKTNIFNGAVIDTTSTSLAWDHHSSSTLSRADRRIGKHRITYVDEWEVLRENINSDKRTIAGKVTQGKHKRIMSNELVTSGGLLYCCNSCESAYCDSCVDWDHTEFVGANPAYQDLGHLPGNMFYIRCAKCAEKRNGVFEVDSIAVKRPRLF